MKRTRHPLKALLTFALSISTESLLSVPERAHPNRNMEPKWQDVLLDSLLRARRCLQPLLVEFLSFVIVSMVTQACISFTVSWVPSHSKSCPGWIFLVVAARLICSIPMDEAADLHAGEMGSCF